MDGAGEHRVGRVVCVSGSQVVAVIEPDGAALPRKGQLVKLPMAETTVFGIVSGLSIPVPVEAANPNEVRLAELELIGEVPQTGEDRPPAFRRGIATFPALGDPVLAADRQDLACVYAPAAGATVRIGTSHLDPSQAALISPDALRGDPVAILGAAGSGKSCAVTLLLQRLLERHPDTRVLLLDPYNAYARAFADSAAVLGPPDCGCPTGCSTPRSSPRRSSATIRIATSAGR